MLSHDLADTLKAIRNNDVAIGLDGRRPTGVRYDEVTDTIVITVKPDANSVDDLILSEDERRFLAMHATYESNKQDDFRYHDKDPARRAELKTRWKQIADALHDDPWGTNESR